MKYYSLMMENNIKKGDMFCFPTENFEQKYHLSRYDLFEGKILVDWDSNFTFYYDGNKGKIPDDFLYNALNWPVISAKFKVILDQFNYNNIQFLPIKIQDMNDENNIINGYHVINITDFSDVLDLDNSKYIKSKLENNSINIIVPAFKLNKIEELDIFRIKERKTSLYISERIYKAINKDKLTGMYYSEIRVTY